MFSWIRRIFGMETSSSGISEHEAQQLERMRNILGDDLDSTDVRKMLLKDFETRSLRRDEGGSSSSPISS